MHNNHLRIANVEDINPLVELVHQQQIWAHFLPPGIVLTV